MWGRGGGGPAEDVPRYEAFPASVRSRGLPVVEFTAGASEQQVWFDGAIVAGRVRRPAGAPDVSAKTPVVMSPAYLGFCIEPYEERYLHYQGVGIVFARPAGATFMQPAIDTILVCCGLERLFAEPGRSFRRLADVGSGSGFIGKFAAMHAPGEGALEVTLVDIDASAMDYARSDGFGAAAVSLGGRGLAWRYHAGDAVELLDRDAGFDLIVSNPPYIPTREETLCSEEVRRLQSGASKSGFWEGCGLLVYLVELVQSSRCGEGCRLVLELSSLSLKSRRVRQVLEEAPASGLKVRILEEREVAWKAWYAGRGGGPDFLLATELEFGERQQIGGCSYFVGATPPGESRVGGSRNRLGGYHWHYVYVLDICCG